MNLPPDQKECNPILISRFLDSELEPEEYDRVKAHLLDCPNCMKSLEEFKNISLKTKAAIQKGLPHFDKKFIESGVINDIKKRKIALWRRVLEVLLSKKGLIPLTALASLCIVSLMVFKSPGPPGPSAIVQSVSGDITSIMIMETPNSRQTILWFNEKS
jgi:hypothetical protein